MIDVDPSGNLRLLAIAAATISAAMIGVSIPVHEVEKVEFPCNMSHHVEKAFAFLSEYNVSAPSAQRIESCKVAHDVRGPTTSADVIDPSSSNHKPGAGRMPGNLGSSTQKPHQAVSEQMRRHKLTMKMSSFANPTPYIVSLSSDDPPECVRRTRCTRPGMIRRLRYCLHCAVHIIW